MPLAVKNPVLTGWHSLLYLLPRGLRARSIARAIVQQHPTWDFDKEPIYLLTTWGDYEIYDAKGRVRPAKNVHQGFRKV